MSAAASRALRAACVRGDAAAVAAQLTAAGLPGSAPVVAALAQDEHAALRWASYGGHAETVAACVSAYGGAGAGATLAALATGALDLLREASRRGDARTVGTLLGASGDRRVLTGICAAGRRPPAVASPLPPLPCHPSCNCASASGLLLAATAEIPDRRNHARRSTQRSATAGHAAAYGPKGCAAVQPALAAARHEALRSACGRLSLDVVLLLMQAYSDLDAALLCVSADLLFVFGRAVGRGLVPTTSALLACFGPPGGPAMLAMLGNYGHRLLHAAAVGTDAAATLALVLESYGPAGCASVVGELAKGEHGVLRAACAAAGADSTTLETLLCGYGAPGCGAVLAALAADDYAPTAIAMRRGSTAAVAALLRAFGGARGALRCALEASDHRCMRTLLDPGFEGNVILALMPSALGDPENETMLSALGACLAAHPELLPAVTVDSALARLAVQTPAAWAINPNAARALLSAPVRTALALPALLALRRLPTGVEAPVAAFLRPRPWLLFASGGVPAALPPE